MLDIEETLLVFKSSLCQKVELSSLIARSNIAHKWKLTYRLLVLREGIGWRFVDILSQAYKLGQEDMIAGSRILTRSAIETLCLLIYMNNQMKSVVMKNVSFRDFEKNTRRMLLGSKKKQGLPEPINVNGIVNKSNEQYDGLKIIYDDLSETVHPNYDGILNAYSKLDNKKFITEFGIFWNEKYGKQHEVAMQLCLEIFEKEYNNTWPTRFEYLEKWLEKNDKTLERKTRKLYLL